MQLRAGGQGRRGKVGLKQMPQPRCLKARVRDTTHANDGALKTVSEEEAAQLW